MDPSRKKSEESSAAIIDSLFDSIAKGEYSVTEDVLATVTTTKLASSKGDLQRQDIPTAVLAKEDGSNKPSTSKNQNDGEISRPSPSRATNGVAKPRSKNKTLKIGALKETTKSQIIESADRVKCQDKGEKPAEEGEIIPSDAEMHDVESGDEEFEVIDESDGELVVSDREDKAPKKKRKKKKKKREKHEHRHKKRKRSRDNGRRKARHKDTENSSRRHEVPEPQPKTEPPRLERPTEQERRPWRKMLNFHLHLDQRRDSDRQSRRDYSSNSPSARRPLPQDYRSGSQSKSYVIDRSKSPFVLRNSEGIARLNQERRSDGRRSYSPDSRNAYSRGDRDFHAKTVSSRPRRSPLEWNAGADRRERFSRQRFRSRSRSRSPFRRRTTSRDHGSRIRAATPEKTVRKSPAKKENKEDNGGRIDKQKLYEIARKNAAAMLKSGVLQKHLSTMSTEDLMKLRSGGKSMEELIEYCRKIQKKEEKQEAGADSSDEGETKDANEDELDEFIRHPFLLKQQSTSFIFNVKNVVQLPIKTPAERAADDAKLRVTFPVSSGEQHRTTESEWVPVSPPPSDKPAGKKSKSHGPLAIEGKAPMLALPPPPSPPILQLVPPPQPPLPVQEPMEQEPVDVGDVVSTRLKAIKRLNDNANDVEAMKMLHFAEEQLKRWADSKNIPGLFMGSTGADCLTPDQLAPPDVRYHAWARKDQLTSAKPVSSGVGMQLLQKMGWKPGEGLGKNREGTLEPLLLQVKSDRKGLLASEEGPNQRIRASSVHMKDFQGKHPVSALMELCSKRRWGPPSFSCSEYGPSHDRRFTWKAVVNGVEYQAATPTSNKKSGKAQVCQVVLQSLGLVPRDSSLPVVIG